MAPVEVLNSIPIPVRFDDACASENTKVNVCEGPLAALGVTETAEGRGGGSTVMVPGVPLARIPSPGPETETTFETCIGIELAEGFEICNVATATTPSAIVVAFSP